MAAARDQAARIIRPEPDTAEATFVRDASTADSPRPHHSEETVARRPAETPDQPAYSQWVWGGQAGLPLLAGFFGIVVLLYRRLR